MACYDKDTDEDRRTTQGEGSASGEWHVTTKTPTGTVGPPKAKQREWGVACYDKDTG